MTRSSTKELFTPFKDPEREFRSSRKHFKTLSLDASRSPDFNLFSDQEEYLEEEVAETMAETMEQYMSKLEPTIDREGGYKATAPGFYQRNNANPSYQEQRKSMEETLSKFMEESAKRHEENSNLIKEIRASTNAAIRNQRASIKTSEIQIGQMSKVLHERGFGSLPSSTETNPRDHVKSILTIVEADTSSICRIGSHQYAVSTRQNSTLILRERMELNLEARLMGETFMLNRSLDPLYGDYIELNDLNVPLELRRDQVDDLMPTIEEGEVIEEFRARNDVRMVSNFFGYPSDYDHDKKIRISCPYNLKFSCMIGFEFLHANFFPILYVNVMSKRFHNSIMKDKLEYKGNNVVRALMNIHIFVGTFYVLTDFTVLEDMDAYRNEGMGDVIFGEPFLREVGINARQFEGMVTIYNGNEEVTYQTVRSHLRLKCHTNEQCNKIPPLLKVSEEDKMNGILHSYQKLKSFYKGVLNLGPEYVLDVKMEEWLTHGHISVHEMD
ncbi:hypothetical protein Tco_1008020 [Tanacetum coccineum]